MEITLAQPADFAAILALQARYHLSSAVLSELEQGFVTTELDETLLERLHAGRGLWIARDPNGELAAYACAVPWEFYGNGRFLDAVRELLPLPLDERRVSADNTFLYGPICIDAPFRGRGLLESLTDAIRARYAAQFAFGLCFIDVRNARSLAAHERKLGFRRVARLPFADEIYDVLVFTT